MSHSAAQSRRNFLKTAAAFAAAPALQAQSGSTWMYVGCYTARGLGIARYAVNTSDGSLTFVKVETDRAVSPNPSFLALDPHGRYLYSCNEIGNFQGAQSGSVTSYTVNPDGSLTELNKQPTQGRNPAHVSVDPTGKFLLAANYSGTTTAQNHLAVFPVAANGSLEPASDIVTHTGTLGPNTGRQEAPHGHQILPDSTGRWILANDLGLDRTFIYWLDRANGKLMANQTPIAAPPGGGPRHLAFHPNGRWLYILNELNSTVSALRWNADTGAATSINNVSSLPPWYTGVNTMAQILVSPDGRYVYASNRGHNSIALFAVDPATGGISYEGREWTFGETPRNFNIDPTGNFMFVAHQNTDNIATFRIDKATGRISFTGRQLLTTGQPVCLIFHAPPAAGNMVNPGVTFTALQNPAVAGSNRLARVALAWNAPGVSEVEIRVGAANGANMGRQLGYDTAITGEWVGNGTTFYLVNPANGATLGTVRVTLAT
jgi:6-phosphogluconolactonase